MTSLSQRRLQEQVRLGIFPILERKERFTMYQEVKNEGTFKKLQPVESIPINDQPEVSGFFAWAAATTVLLIIILIKRLIIYFIQDPAQQQQQPAQQEQQQPAQQQQQQPAQQQQQQPAQQPAEFVHTPPSAASTPSTSNFSTPSSVEPLITSNIADRTRSKSGIKKKLFKAK